MALATSPIVACVGRNVVPPETKSLRLGVTRCDEVRREYGKPSQDESVVRNGEVIRSLTYVFASGGKSLIGGVTPMRAAAFYCWHDVLVGYEFSSSFADDSTDFDTSRIERIRAGETTRDQVVALMGRPGGLYRHPLLEDEDDTALVYLYHQIKGWAFGLRSYEKQLIVAHDGAGVVTDVDFRESGEK